MLAAVLVFFVAVGFVIGGYAAVTRLLTAMAEQRLERRLREVGQAMVEVIDGTVVKHQVAGPLPAVERALARTGAGAHLAKLIEQSGTGTTPSAILVISIVSAAGAAFVCNIFVRQPAVALLAGIGGLCAPTGWLFQRRTARLRRFEEQFPEALDLLSRAIRAGHAFQSALGMVAEELPPPVGAEFRKTFDEQNYGLPLKDALNELAQRIPLVDVRFFVTAVAIQRESGGNLSEILDNLGYVVRERFKILRQVRVHTAHGRFTGYVLLGLPAALAIAISYLSPEHMNLMFTEPLGRTMLIGAVIMQTVGFFWIRQVVKIEV